MSTERQALFLNAVPLFVLAGIYLAAAALLLPLVLRRRGDGWRQLRRTAALSGLVSARVYFERAVRHR